ncbi:sialate O-acetylesterase [Aquiflexum sp. TKW24L]|uniref:sialate O-acetylesterase n=1 Tax=Aquiflexum sp. TKW24L TaxID=2942212 RepID=UPI0020C15F08|nr:sialate O-acetylesterase [Aquiflexum sp. TKW24L]MCL6260595.1 sialate O-acetylesterase [Aquiflexum sp. TKW24L]
MRNSIFKATLFGLAFLVFSCQSNEPLTEVFMPKFFADHMVFQRNQPIRVWGDGTPGKNVVGKFNNQEKETEIDENGYWTLEFDPMPASGPFVLDVNGKKIRGIQIGDVWVAGGQSNMEWVMSAQVEGLPEEIADSGYPLIRFFKIPHDYDAKEKTDVRGGEWRMANADNILNFSAVAWFFAKKNHLEKGVPIGIIESNWGGTPAEGWTSATKLIDFPPYQAKAKDVLDRKDYWIQEIIDNKVRELKRNELVAAPQNGEIKGVVNIDFDDADWQRVNLPADNPFSDIAWFRKKFNLTDTENVSLNLGDIQQMAYIYLNGGRLLFKDYGDAVKEFPIPSTMLNKGENLLVVRIINTWNNAPVLGKSGEFFVKSSGKKISLEGEWKYNNRIEEEIPKVEWYNWQPGMMYNAMIAPIVKYPIKGVIWYQGESNTGDHQYYKQLFSTMIQNWREAWGIGDFPFLFVQLANFMKREEVQPDSDWAFLREAQTQTLDLPNTGMAVTIDVGNANDIHPRNKKDVGHRLWQVARKVAYGEDVIHSGPSVASVEKKGEKVLVTFNNVGEGLQVSSGTEVTGFILAGEDGQFEIAKGKIVGTNQVEVYSSKVKNPVEVRFAWADNPEFNLYNSLSLPAVPFRKKIND